MKSRKEALELLHEWVKSESLRRHCFGVATCMESYARHRRLTQDEIDKWFICGLLHDFDYEKFPDVNVHPKPGCDKLEEEGYGLDIVEAIMGHNEATGIQRISLMAKTLFAVDELSGLVYALAKVRPGNFVGMNVKSVKKAMKKKDFAANINRSDIEKGMLELGLQKENVEGREQHFMLVIRAMESIKSDLGF